MQYILVETEMVYNINWIRNKPQRPYMIYFGGGIHGDLLN